MTTLKVLESAGPDEQGPDLKVRSRPNIASNYDYSLLVTGDLVGSMIVLQCSDDGVVWVSFPDLVIMKIGAYNVSLKVPYVRAKTTGGGPGTNVNATLT